LGARCPFFCLDMEWVQNATIRSPIGAPEVVRHDIKHVWIFLNGTRINIIVIQVIKSNFPTTATSMKVSPSDYDNDRQLEIAIWPPKSLLFPVVGRCRNHLGALSLNSSWSEFRNPRFAVGNEHIVVHLLERAGAFLAGSAIRMCKNRSAIRGSLVSSLHVI